MIEINNNPDRSATFHGQGPIAVKVSPFARRLQRGIAFGVVVLPLVGFIVAMIQLWKYGISVVDVALLAVMYVVTIIGETVGYHRHFAHRAFDTSKTMRAILAILGSMTAQGPIVFWVAVHRRHHAYSDREGDPHSPNLHGKGLSGLDVHRRANELGKICSRDSTGQNDLQNPSTILLLVGHGPRNSSITRWTNHEDDVWGILRLSLGWSGTNLSG